jgi:hypothetical protein
LYAEKGISISFKSLNNNLHAIGAGNVSNKWIFNDYPRIVKSHLKRLPLMKYKYAIGLLRDPRDVMVSYYHYKKHRGGAYEGNFQSFIRDSHYGLQNWFKHYSSWINYWDVIIRYENLRSNTHKEFLKIFNLLNIEDRCSYLPEAIRLSNLKNIRKLDTLKQKKSDQIQSNNEYFARSGKVNQWQEYFNDQDLEYYSSFVININNTIEFPYN